MCIKLRVIRIRTGAKVMGRETNRCIRLWVCTGAEIYGSNAPVPKVNGGETHWCVKSWSTYALVPKHIVSVTLSDHLKNTVSSVEGQDAPVRNVMGQDSHRCEKIWVGKRIDALSYL